MDDEKLRRRDADQTQNSMQREEAKYTVFVDSEQPLPAKKRRRNVLRQNKLRRRFPTSPGGTQELPKTVQIDRQIAAKTPPVYRFQRVAIYNAQLFATLPASPCTQFPPLKEPCNGRSIYRQSRS